MICPCENEQPDPCPACGATVADGICKATEPRPPEPLGFSIVVIHKDDLRVGAR